MKYHQKKNSKKVKNKITLFYCSGILQNNKSFHLPAWLRLVGDNGEALLTAKDEADIEFAIRHGAAFVASAVHSAADVLKVKSLLGKH